jgi:hypothetical protein
MERCSSGRPQVALLVNEATLYPVLMPLAPAAILMDRFLEAAGQTLKAHGVPDEFHRGRDH